MSGLLWGVQTCWNSKQYLLVSKWAEVDSGNSVLTITPHASEPHSPGRCPKCEYLQYLPILIWTNSLFGSSYVQQQTDELFLGRVSVGHWSGTR